MKLIHIFYHSVDLDGICSAAIVRRFHSESEMVMHPINYGQALPWPKIGKGDTVYMVDFSIEPAELYQLARSCRKLIWIDHHKTAVEAYEDYKRTMPGIAYNINGLREIGRSGCELTWAYMTSKPLPRSVFLLGRYDVWDHSDPDTLPFQYGMRELDLKPESERWRSIFADEDLASIIEVGSHILKYDRQLKKRTIKSGAFCSRIGDVVVLACNGGGGSDLFKDADPLLLQQAQALCSFQYSGAQQRWIYGIYNIPGKDVDVSEIAKLYGGGGHKDAAGFQSADEILIVNRIRTEEKNV